MPVFSLGAGMGLFKFLAPKIIPIVLDAVINVAEEIVEQTDNELDDNIVAILKGMKETFVKEILSRL